jgi:alkanesulfonate monooxygenase SsuD/methylene tetrahydromethanopterin reductase-like flavin-dependent oxidoreductase (luciferase family)
MAAIGPQMLRLAGELADGVLGYCWSLEYVRDVVLPNLRAGAERGGRSLDGFDVACGFPALVGDRALDEIRGQAMMFATAGGSSPEYAQSFAAAGYAAEVAQIAEHFANGAVPAALDVVTEEMADAVTIAGPPDHVQKRVEAYRAAGLGTLALNPAPPDVFFPLYEGHFPDGTAFPEFSFPAYLGAFDGVLELAG